MNTTIFRHITRRRTVRGFTLVELLVAMAIGLLIVLITVATLTASRQGATVVDAAAQLRDRLTERGETQAAGL